MLQTHSNVLSILYFLAGNAPRLHKERERESIRTLLFLNLVVYINRTGVYHSLLYIDNYSDFFMSIFMVGTGLFYFLEHGKLSSIIL